MEAKLADLGEARLTDTVFVHIYSSPERNENRPLTPATDVFSMGLTMTELFSGKKLVYSIASSTKV
jgi:serine/threonine protein kinase